MAGEEYRHVFKPRPSGRGPDRGRTAHAPAYRPGGLWQGRTYGPPATRRQGSRTSEVIGGAVVIPAGPQIVLACPRGVNPAARPIPPNGDVIEELARRRRGAEGGIGVPG